MEAWFGCVSSGENGSISLDCILEYVLITLDDQAMTFAR